MTTAQWQALADALKAAWFSTSGPGINFGIYGGKVVAYDLADDKPRPEKAYSNFTPGVWSTNYACPRQICLRVSMYSVRNLPRLRGGIYVPMVGGSILGERPTASELVNASQQVRNLYVAAQALTPSWLMGIYSKRNDSIQGVTNWWINDVFDTQRRRVPKETHRNIGTFP